ncbi:MAG: endonuclease III [Rickettsiaceae bacterium]|nr:endonuclease III [Rickettsiaceae bacterium]
MGATIQQKNLKNISDKANSIFSTLAAINPDPKTELEYKNLYTLLVAVALSAQTTDMAVNKATKKLFEIAYTPDLMIELGQDKLLEFIKSLNFCYTKSRNIINMSEIIMDKFSGLIPLTLEELITLPGVGRKTANVVLNCWKKEKTMPVDTHVFRVAKRLGLAGGSNPVIVEQELLNNIPEKWLVNAHHWLILHGRYICKAKKPECTKCPIQDFCDFFRP